MGDVWCEDPNKESDPDDLSGLADLWDKNRGLRHQVLKRKSLLEWESPKLNGHISYKSLMLNVKLIEVVVGVWCPKHSTAKTVPLDNVKWQARHFKSIKNQLARSRRENNTSLLFIVSPDKWGSGGACLAFLPGLALSSVRAMQSGLSCQWSLGGMMTPRKGKLPCI